MNSLISLPGLRQTAAIVAVLTLTLSAFAVSFFVSPLSAHAATELITNGDFGTGNDQNNIPDWEEKGNEGNESTKAKKPTSGNNSVSPNGGRFAMIGRFNNGADGDGWICQEVNAADYENLSLSYLWRGDNNAENSGNAQDSGYVEYLLNGSCETADNQWTNLKTYSDITNTGWQSDSVDLSALDGETFFIRFRSSVNAGNEDWRIDGVSLTGDDAVSVPACDLTAEHPGFTTFDTFALGTVDGQNSWSSTGSFDQSVVENIYGYTSFGCQSLRLSNAVTSGSFGDQTFAAPVGDAAGETGTANHFEAQFDIAATQLDEQSGLAVSVSPDDGNGSRMSYLGFADEAGGIRVTFYDVVNAGPLPTGSSFNPTDLGVLDRSTPHTIKFVIDFVDGPANDVVTIYIDGSLVHTGTTWEDYYRFDPEQSGNGNVLFPIDTLIFRAAGTAAPGTSGEGYLFDNLSIETSLIAPEPIANSCVLPDASAGAGHVVFGVSNEGVSLQKALDDRGYSIDTVNDQEDYEVWNADADNVDFTATYVAGLGGASVVFGYYVNGDLNTFVPLFEKGDHPDFSLSSVSEGDTEAFSVSLFSTVGFAIYRYEGESNQAVYATQTVLNGDGEDHAAVYNPAENVYVVAFEDRDIPDDDEDYNDLIVKLVVDGCEDYPAGQCQNLLINGSFEEPVVTHNALWDKFASVTGWVIENVTDDTLTTLELHRGWSGNAAAEGEQYAELDGDHSTRITQPVATIPGATYELSWAFAPRHNIAAEQNHLSVLVDGVEVATEGPATGAAGLAAGDWTHNSYSFVALDSTVDIAFADAGPSNTFGTFLDDAQLCLVAEPDTAPYCGDGIKNQDWEQCELGDTGCTDWCQLETNQCTEDVFARVVVSEVSNTGAGDATSDVYLGQGADAIPEGTWFPVKLGGAPIVDAPVSGYEDVPGLAVARGADGVTVLLHGSQTASDKEHVEGYVEFSTGSMALSQASLTTGNDKLENPTDSVKQVKPGQDEIWIDGGLSYFWLTTTTADDGFVTEYHAPSCTLSATVTLCKVDSEAAPLAGWTLSLFGDLVDSFDVPVDTAAGTDSSVSLTGGAPYIALASGTWLNDRTPDNLVDAEYSVENDWDGNPIMDGFTGYGTSILELAIDGTDGDWGPYTSTHQYAQGFTLASDGTVNFAILDSNYADNSGSLQVEIYEGFTAVTDHTGCVVFDNVPFGTYALDEQMQVGWENVSGLGDVVIDDEQETFEVVNVALDTITVEKWSDDNESGVRDDGEDGVAGWDIVVKPQTLTPVDEFTVDSSSQTGTDTSVSLTSGRIYLVEAEGTYVYGGANRVADAEYHSTNAWTTASDWGADNPTEDQRTLDLVIDDAELHWGSYTENPHLYKTVVTGDDAVVNFRIFERTAGHYSDNSGELTVRIYDVTDHVVTTGDDGTATVDVVPGEYQIVEMQREGWTQTAPTGPSYCHLDTTNDETSCSFGNYKTPDAPETATFVATKIVCEAEIYLPNWGDGSYEPITETTATDWLAATSTVDTDALNSDHCWLEPGWQFEWVSNAVTSADPGDNLGVVGAPWNLTGATIADGTVSVTVPAGDRVWVREVFRDTYVPFAGQHWADKYSESAEFYCHTDVLNYDNREWIEPVEADQTYYCVAWNALIPGAPELTIVKESYDGSKPVDGAFDFEVTNGFLSYTGTPHIDTVDGYGTTTLQLPGEGTFNVRELLSGDWVLADVWCEYDSSTPTGSPITDGYEITVAPGDEVTCHFKGVTDCDDSEYYDESTKQCEPRNGNVFSDLDIDKTVDDETPDAGQHITYTITVTNFGPNMANTIEIEDVLPSGLTYVSHSAFSGTYATSTGLWVLPSLGVNASTTLDIVVAVNDDTEGDTITNTAHVVTNVNTDNDDSNDSKSVSVTVNTPPVTTTSSGGGGGGGNPNFATFGFGGGIVAGASTSAGEVLGDSCGLYMDQFLRRDWTGNNTAQVIKLQEFLNKHGFGALDITGIFGLDTETAVKNFQQQYADEILTPWGLSEPTGLVYITTLRQINLIECPHLSLQIPELIAWSFGGDAGSSFAANTAQGGTQQGGDTGSEAGEGGTDDSGSDQTASASGAVKGQGFWGRVWGFFFSR